MTGIFPVKKYKTESALNNFWEYSMIDPEEMSSFFGFTPEEVEALYIDMNIEGLKDDIINMLAGGRCHVDITGFANDMHEVHTKQIKIPGGNSLGYFLNAA